ncbi:AraC family transcriptional regulator [Enterobacter sichuanensis]
MDPFSDILNLLSATSYATAGLSAGPDWAMSYSGFNGFKLMVVRRGGFWFKTTEESVWHRLENGDGLILTRPTPFIMATNRNCKPAVSDEPSRLHRRQTVNYGGNDNLLLAGKMEFDQTFADLLIKEFPRVIFFHTSNAIPSGLSLLMKMLFEEKFSAKPGAIQACDHLMHLIMIEVLRSGHKLSGKEDTGIISAYQNKRIITTINAIHDEPARAWRLEELATVAGMSRAGFAKKFKDITGSSPLAYVTNWRLRIASKLLRQNKCAIKEIAFALGYRSESIFSTAFKRVYGVSPSAYRQLNHSGQ